LRKTVAGLAALVVLLTGIADARGLFDFYIPREKQGGRAGTLSRNEALGLYSAKQRVPSFEACADLFPRKKPPEPVRVPEAMKPMALCSDNFAVLYSQTSKTPLVVFERLSAAQIRDAKGEERTNQFYPDPRIPKSGRAELSDYRAQQPAVDRGHQAPAGDAPNPNAMAQSFALSNMVPQDPTNNRKVWNKVESDVRKFAQRAQGNVFVFTGPLFDKGHETVGENKVWKPTRLFKLVYDESSGRAWAYVLPNSEVRLERPMDYATFVKTTGLHLLDGLAVTGTVGRS
jgi:DNA/RNA endonuclease G (NUC1)